MRAKWFLVVITGSWFLLVTERTFAQSVVYDNTATYLGTAEPAYIEDGNEVTLAGNQRVVTNVAIAVEVEGEGFIAIQASLSLYVNDGPYEGSPGTLLWQSDFIPHEIARGGPQFIHFAVPSVRVPDTLIWTIKLYTPKKAQIRLSQFHPPVVGSVRYGSWSYGLGWPPWRFLEGVSPFGPVVTVDLNIPVVSHWGAVALTVALLSAGAVIITRANRRESTARSLPGAALLSLLYFFAWASSTAGQVQVGPQIRIDGDEGTAAAMETSIASSNSNPNVIVASWMDWRESTTTEFVRIGVAMSLNGGGTWTDFLVRPPPGYQTQYEVDPMTAYDDRTGTLWVGGISYYPIPYGIFVARKIAGQPAFQPSVMASPGSADKGWMAAGPAPGNPTATNVYIAYDDGVLRSTDMGETWSGPVTFGVALGFIPRVGPNGELYVAYAEFFPGKRLFLRRSLDGGQSFGPRRTIATRMEVWYETTNNPHIPGLFRVPHFAYLAVDQNNGSLYFVYFDATDMVGGNFNMDLYFTKSTNQGFTWTTPVVINGDANPPGDQFWPWIEVDEQSNLHIVFLDSRHTPQDDSVEHGMFDAYYSFSNDEGATWQEFRLTPASFDSANDGLDLPDEQFLGDYVGLARAQDRVYPCYLSTQNGNPDIYTHVIQHVGGCCLAGSCALLSRDSCVSQGGTFLGAWTTCSGPDCNNNGVLDACEGGAACCLTDDSCVVWTASCCVNQGGSFTCVGSTCQDTNGNAIADVCESPVGACCGTACTVETQACCSSQGGAFMGVGTTCDDCNENGDPDACETEGLHPCCLPSLSCVLWTAECCSAVGGQYFPTKLKCTSVNCTAMGPAFQP
jgi:hypothetical protein